MRPLLWLFWRGAVARRCDRAGLRVCHGASLVNVRLASPDARSCFHECGARGFGQDRASCCTCSSPGRALPCRYGLLCGCASGTCRVRFCAFGYAALAWVWRTCASWMGWCCPRLSCDCLPSSHDAELSLALGFGSACVGCHGASLVNDRYASFDAVIMSYDLACAGVAGRARHGLHAPSRAGSVMSL